MRRRPTWFFAICLTLLLAGPALAQQVDLSGPWFLDFPLGRGTVVLQKSTDSPPSYSGLATIPNPANPKMGLSFRVTLHSMASAVVPGKDIIFLAHNNVGVQFFIMNVSGSSSGIAWIIPTQGAEPMLKYYGVKAPAHR